VQGVGLGVEVQGAGCMVWGLELNPKVSDLLAEGLITFQECMLDRCVTTQCIASAWCHVSDPSAAALSSGSMTLKVRTNGGSFRRRFRVNLNP